MKENPTFRDFIQKLARKRGSEVAVFADFCRMVACCLSAGARESEYLEIAGSYDREELEGFSHGLGALTHEMENSYFEDVLGPYYLEIASKSTKDLRGEFFTPRSSICLIPRRNTGN